MENSTLVPIYKNKKIYNQDYMSYNEILRESNRTKTKKENFVFENQFDLMPGRSTIEVIYLLRQLMESTVGEEKRPIYDFILLKKAYDSFQRGDEVNFRKETSIYQAL